MSRGDRLRAEIATAGFAHATVSGTSMLPTLRAGEIVRLEPAEEVLPGHIVAFEQGGGLLVHRVLRVGSDHIVCRGDNRVMHDGLTPRAAIVGRVIEVFGQTRRGGERLRDDAAALRRIDLRVGLRRARGRIRHVVAEGALFARQAVARGQDASIDGTARSPLDLSLPFTLSSRLTSLDRVALVRAWLEHETDDPALTLRALALTPACRLARAGAVSRRTLARLGVAAGEPGDTVLPGTDGVTLQPVHLFSRAELVAEVESAGACVTGIELETVCAVPAWRATVARCR